jgi:hypothetical protein
MVSSHCVRQSTLETEDEDRNAEKAASDRNRRRRRIGPTPSSRTATM